jgi:CxxC motif-containing protein (DUF1111 family)
MQYDNKKSAKSDLAMPGIGKLSLTKPDKSNPSKLWRLGLAGLTLCVAGQAQAVVTPQVLVQAEDYANYFDTSAGNNGGQYRSDDVDIEATSDSSAENSGGYNVGWTAPSEWLEYDITLGAGTYDLSTRVASNVGGASYSLLLDGNVIGTDSVGFTGGWQTFETHDVTQVTVTEGQHTLRIEMNGGEFNLNWLNLLSTVQDNDNDGVIDSLDLCANTPAGTPVDASGCAQTAGLTQTSDSSVTFYVNSNSWSDVHYSVNSGLQQNVRMTLANGQNSLALSGVTSGDVISYWFTYLSNEGPVVDTAVQTHTMGGTTVSDSDGDGVVDGFDQCANTPAGTSVDSVGCPIVVDTDNDGVIDSVDQCANTPAGTPVDTLGCPVVFDTDNDGVIDSLDQCANTPVGTTVDANGCAVVTAGPSGLTQTSNSSVTFYVNSNGWADVHYSVNSGLQQNVRMSLANGQNSQVFSGLALGDVVSYSFTYLSGTGSVVDTAVQNHTMAGTVSDSDGDGVADSVDQCANTPTGTSVDSVGCPIVVVLDADNDGVLDAVDQCPNTPAGTSVDSVGCPIVLDADNDGVIDSADQCPNTPAGTSVDSVGCPIVVVVDADNDGVVDSVDQCPNTPTGTSVDSVGCAIVVVPLGDIVPLYGQGTVLEQAIHFDRGDAIITRFADRGRDRHAKEDQFQSYDHYLTHYWTHRTARFEIVDYVSKGGSTIVVDFITEWRIGAREFRAWYYGMNTVAEYHGNYQNGVTEVAHGTFDDNFNQISTSGSQYKYSLTISEHRGLNGSIGSLAMGQQMEIEVSQFLSGVPEGRSNYYGTTYLYSVGEGGLVPWYTVGDFAVKSSERENSHRLDESAWLGGRTTLPYNYTNEPDNHFMQMATNLSSVNGQAFVLGRRVHHTDFETGQHDENIENGVFAEMVGKAGSHYVNTSCSGCHERNGRAAPVAAGVPLDKWVFKVGDANGNPDAQIGRVLQPDNVGINNATDGEGSVSIASWTELNGLRSPNYAFTKGTPAQFSARIAPQLVGLGLLEAIPETAILALEDADDAKNNDGITGKAQLVIDPVTGDTRLGRFGYKAGTSSVKHQVAAAFNTDMGVMTSVLPQPDCGSAQTVCGNSGTELADTHLDNLVKYIALLGVRAQRNIGDAQVQQGKALFSSIGCVGCHTGTFQTSASHPFSELRDQTIHPYTDLLLHDMGAGLADNLAEGQATGAEWRTAPLWGLGLSACVTGGVINPTGGQGNEVCVAEHSYLHDGRARSITEAILWHGGEGEASKVAFEALSANDKNAVLAFLESL